MLFQAYTRLGRAERVGGLGLGLFVSREIVVAHGGDISATSQLGDGTTIKVVLPTDPPSVKPHPRTKADRQK
jgi:signal transduction histidine kinase